MHTTILTKNANQECINRRGILEKASNASKTTTTKDNNNFRKNNINNNKLNLTKNNKY
jgi:hypothetical protein